MRRKVKKFKVHCNGKMDWQRYQTPEEMRLFYKNARIVSEKSYQEKLLDSGLPNSATFKKKMLDLAHKGFVRGYLLYRDDQPVAYMYCPVDDGVLLYQYLGYDPQYFKWSVGSILHWYAFEDMFKEGCFSYFDFTEGQSDHKRRYSTGSLLCGNVFVFPKNLRCGFIIYSHAGMNWLSQTLGTMFVKMGLKQKIKKFIRFGLKK